MLYPRLVTAFVCAGCFFLAGCGDDKTATVSGKVTFDGVPVDNGAISFVPADGKTPSAAIEFKKDGTFSLRVPVGPKKVEIHGSRVVGKKKLYNTPDSETMDVLEAYIPAKYNVNTELTFEVKPGTNQRDFDLTSK